MSIPASKAILKIGGLDIEPIDIPLEGFNLDFDKTPEETPRLFGAPKGPFKSVLAVVDGDIGPCYLCTRRCNTRYLKSEKDPGLRVCPGCAREHLSLV